MESLKSTRNDKYLFTYKSTTKKNSNICLTCLKKGKFKAVCNTYYHNKKPEIYSEMLSFCFSLQLAPTVESDSKYYICDKCITQLRITTAFRKQIEEARTYYNTVLDQNVFLHNFDDRQHNFFNELSDVKKDQNTVMDRENVKPKIQKSPMLNETNGLFHSNFEIRNENCTSFSDNSLKSSEQLIRNKKILQIDLDSRFSSIIKDEIFVKDETEFNWSGDELHSNPEIIKTVKSAAKRGGIYECELCSFTSEKVSKLSQHVKSHSQDKLFLCDICGKAVAKLKSHLMTHSSIKPYQCDKCRFSARLDSTLKCHMRIHCDTKPFVCDKCGSGFRRSQHLRVHERTHNKATTIKCGNCDYVASNSKALIRHSKNHGHGYICDFCNDPFDHVTDLRIHKMTKHNVYFRNPPSLRKINNGEYLCKLCNKSFSSLTGLKSHSVTHVEERAFACDTCNTRFKRKGDLTLHFTTHTKIKPFSCELCPFTTARIGLLRDHKKKHSDFRPYECCHCSLKFKRKKHLKNHMVVHSDDKPFVCVVCSFKCKRISDLKHHAFVHLDVRLSCSSCDYTCLQKRQMTRHTLMKHPEHKIDNDCDSTNKLVDNGKESSESTQFESFNDER